MPRWWVSRTAGLALACLLVASASPGFTQQGEEPGSGQGEVPRPPEPAPESGDLSPRQVGPPTELLPPPGIEAIEVTGERMDDANVQDEAQAITAFSGADLERASIVSVDSLAFNVPGLHVGQSGQAPIITLRGIGTENASLTGEPGVAFHVDGINLGRPAAARVAFFDLQTLDVKRGPQGLLGGKNSTSGTINLISNKPTDEYEVGGDVLFGNYDRVRMRGVINVPVGEYLSTRLALYRETRDGYLDNAYLSDSHDPFDSDDFGLRARARLNPTDTLELNLSYNYFKQDGNGPQADVVALPQHLSQEIPPPPGSVQGCQTAPELTYTTLPLAAACFPREIAKATTVAGRVPTRTLTGTRRTGRPFETEPYSITQRGTPVPGIDPRTGRPVAWANTFFPQATIWDPATEDGDPRSVYVDVPSSQQNRYWGWSTTVDWDTPTIPLLGETHLKLLGGFQRTLNYFGQDFDATDAPLSGYSFDDQAKQYSGEIQWSGELAERLEWQASLFHLHEKAERDLDAPGRIDANASLLTTQSTNNKAYGAALHGTYQLTDALRFSLGGRFIKDKKKTTLLRESMASGDDSYFRGCTGNLGRLTLPTRPFRANRGCSLVDRHTMWGSGIDWRPFGDEHLLYARIDRGAKSGGFRAGTVGEYKPERIWAYALGTKSEFFDQRLRLNLEGFVYNYQDLQIVVVDGLALRTENTDARMYGWDLETQASPIEGMLLSAVVSYLHTETIEYLSMDPANPDQYLLRRLEMRDLADAFEADNVDIQYEDLGCLIPGQAEAVPCGTLPGTTRGLDDFSDHELSRAPEWKLTLSAEYEIPIGRFGTLTPRIQYSWQDDTYFRAFNRDFDMQEAYHLTNAKLIWTSPEQTWSVEAFVENIEDEAPMQNILIGPRYFGSPPLAWYSPPRFYGMQVSFKY